VLQDVGPRLEMEHHVELQQLQMAGVECMAVRVLAHEHRRVLSGQGKPTGNMVIIQPNQKSCIDMYDGYCVRVEP
jgi:hypothetical protein